MKFPWTRRRDVARFQLALIGFKPENHPEYVRYSKFYDEYYWNDLFEKCWKNKDWNTCELILKAKYGDAYISWLKLPPIYGFLGCLIFNILAVPISLQREMVFHCKIRFFILDLLLIVTLLLLFFR